MKTGGGTMMTKRMAGVLIALAMGASACTGSATVTQTGTTATSVAAEPTVAQVDNTEPTAVPAVEEPPSVVPEPTPTAVGPPVVQLPTDAFRADAVLGLSSDGAFAYAGTSSPWNDATSCDDEPTDSLVAVDVVAAATSAPTIIAAGLEQAGDVRQMVFGANSSVAILSSCGSADADPELWMQRGELGADGRLVSLGPRLDMNAAGESDPYVLRWVDDESVELRVIIEEDPEDFETWLVERRQLSLSSGQVVRVEQYGYFDDDGFNARGELETENGTYRVIDDPAGRLGCEGFGVAVTLQLDTGDEQRLALTQPEFVFSDISELHMSPDGYISWTSGCEGFVSAYVGRVRADGMIADAHLIETFSFLADTYVDIQYYRLSNDGFLHGVGQSFDPDADANGPDLLRYDLAADPHFVNTAEPAPLIETEPLFAAVGEDGTWHVGETLGAEPACGAQTLYGKTPGGFVRAFPAGVEIDEIVDVHVGETRRISYPDGDFVSRTVVVQTACPASYEGRRVWFGIETEDVIWGLWFERADLGEVADVLGVRDVLQDGTEFVETSIVQVELLDGTVAEVELVRLPDQD